MYAFLTYPMEVIKTNRILNTSLSREAGESIPREIVALYERGGVSQGLYRGLLFGFLAANAQAPAFKQNPHGSLFIASLYTLTSTPFQIMQLHKQVFNSSTVQSYGQLYKEVSKGNPLRIFTLGVIPSFFRNFILCTGFTPALMGHTFVPLSLLFCTGAIALSHPFEVARVII